jgi:spore germination cell wall hydrolase CwlJ-like protein
VSPASHHVDPGFHRAQGAAVRRQVIVACAVLVALGRPACADAPSGREVRCLALVAYTEAAVDGEAGMAAVIRVVRNRMADSRFPDDACTVVAQVAQFQPVAQSAVLQQVVRDPEGYSIPQVLGLRTPAARRLLARAHALARTLPRRPDPTGGALYFVNPDLMDPERCPWFAALKRTARIGGHVFMTHYRPGEPPGPPALDCGPAGGGEGAAAAPVG